jgi:hypothetical protein
MQSLFYQVRAETVVAETADHSAIDHGRNTHWSRLSEALVAPA